MDARYLSLQQALSEFIPARRLITDPLRTLAYGTDASFYRLVPRLVVKVVDEHEVIRVLRHTRELDIPVTFRAAGTSLSGQAVSDSVLLVLSGEGWRDYRISEDGGQISLQPGIVGAQANDYLAPYGRKIGPDPASINAAKIGGIAANNASGMCCGTAHNSYHTLQGMRLVLADGSLLDTRDSESVERFRASHESLLNGLQELADGISASPELKQRIQHKYRLKNTTGYSLNALVDFSDPLEMLQHLMIGSEGTLGFISEITYRTVEEHPAKATALVLFPDVETACQAVATLKSQPVTAVELMDRAGLRSVEEKPGMPEFLRQLDNEVSALLVDVRAADAGQLGEQIGQVQQALAQYSLVRPAEFTSAPVSYQQLWNIRKGLFPAVGAVRQTGTTVIIEDIAFAVEDLAAGVRELQALFEKYHYHEALIFGHALEGNLHFVFTQDFSTQAEVRRYHGLMDEVCQLVAGKYGGSLKAEHGTGRNMAPYVEMEWGSDAYAIMWRLKRLFDPDNLLNPGVILNEDPEIHLKNLKPLPAADSLVDTCIECGFCEAICPSRELTLTPRQRIVSWREINRLAASGDDEQRREALLESFDYQGIDTCAVDGLCASRCPVGIDTGLLTRKLRQQRRGATAHRVGRLVNRHFSAVSAMTRAGLRVAGAARAVIGDQRMGSLANGLRRLSGDRLPPWNSQLPRAAGALSIDGAGVGANGELVYFPSCVSRTMGPAKGDPCQDDLHQRVTSLARKAGVRLIVPRGIEGFCCGMPLESKGLAAEAEAAVRQLEEALWVASRQGELPVLCDTSPCTQRMVERFQRPLKIYEPVGAIRELLLPHLKISQRKKSVALHITCSSRKMGLEAAMTELAGLCAEQVVLSEDKGCCGFAGDKGFTTPELNAAALQRLRQSIPADCDRGYSNSRTCEIGLSLHAGIPYQSIAYLVDECSEAGESS